MLLRRVRCVMCGERFGGKPELMNHMQVAHGGDPRYDCRECGEYFASMEEMRTHLQRRHRYGGSGTRKSQS